MRIAILALTILVSTISFASEKTPEVVEACHSIVNIDSLAGLDLFNKCITSEKSAEFVYACGRAARMMNEWDSSLLFADCLDLNSEVELVETCIDLLDDVNLLNRPRFFLACAE